jgi:DNA-binding transcriptional MerR regulator
MNPKAAPSRVELPPPPVPASPVGSLGIAAVARITGVSEHTLRMWERRYGFPLPERASGGARLYSTEDVRKLRLIQQALERGHRPGEVVGQNVPALEALLPAGLAGPRAVVEDPLAREREQILDALRRQDVRGIREGLRRLSLMVLPRRFVVEVAHPLAVRVGELWATGEIEVHQEHLFTDCLSTQLRIVRSLLDEGRGPILLLTTLPGEPHALGLEMVALYSAAAGASPRVLGAATPPDQLVRAAHAHQAAAVGLTITPSSDLATTDQAVREIVPPLTPATQVWLGGGGAANLAAVPGTRAVATWAQLDAALSSLGQPHWPAETQARHRVTRRRSSLRDRAG